MDRVRARPCLRRDEAGDRPTELRREIEELRHTLAQYSQCPPKRTVSTQTRASKKAAYESATQTDAVPYTSEWLSAALETANESRRKEQRFRLQEQKTLTKQVQAARDRQEQLRMELARMYDKQEKSEMEMQNYKGITQMLQKELYEVIEELRIVQEDKQKDQEETDEEIQKHIAKSLEWEEKLYTVSEQLQVFKNKAQISQEEHRQRETELARVQRQNQQLGEQLTAERQQKIQLQLQTQLETQKRVMAEQQFAEERIRYQELFENLQWGRENESLYKQQEIQAAIGVPVNVRRVGRGGMLTEGDLNFLTPAMINQMKAITDKFAEHLPVQKIEYIINDQLYKLYNDTRQKFRRMGRGTQEVLVFHGTGRNNINT